jgi:hypothetical protein
MTASDLDHTIRVIRARCSDALAPSDLDLIEAALTGGDAIAEVLERIEDVLDAMDERLETMEEAT